MSPPDRDQTKTPSPVRQENTDTHQDDTVPVSAATTDQSASLEEGKDMEDVGETEEVPRSSSPPNPFDESDEEEEEVEEEKEQDTKTEAKPTTNGDLPSAHISHHEAAARPVPAPRRVSECTPPPRPAPRQRLQRTGDSLSVGMSSVRNIKEFRCIRSADDNRNILIVVAGENQKPPMPPKPRERSQSPGRYRVTRE